MSKVLSPIGLPLLTTVNGMPVSKSVMPLNSHGGTSTIADGESAYGPEYFAHFIDRVGISEVKKLFKAKIERNLNQYTF